MKVIYVPVEVPDEVAELILEHAKTSESKPLPQVLTEAAKPPAAAPEPPAANPASAAICKHGERRFVPSGVSKAGRPYKAFWACPAERTDPDKCKSIPA